MVGHCFARRKARCLLLVARRRRLVVELAADADCAKWDGGLASYGFGARPSLWERALK